MGVMIRSFPPHPNPLPPAELGGILAYFDKVYFDGIVKIRHSRENGNPENSNYMKILDSCLRRNDRQWPFQTFYETIYFRLIDAP